MRSQDKNYLDITLAELAYCYLTKKRIEPTTGNLFWLMHKIQIKLDYINQHGKKINFAKGHCEYSKI